MVSQSYFKTKVRELAKAKSLSYSQALRELKNRRSQESFIESAQERSVDSQQIANSIADMSRKRSIYVDVTGPSASGKTSLVQRLATNLRSFGYEQIELTNHREKDIDELVSSWANLLLEEMDRRDETPVVVVADTCCMTTERLERSIEVLTGFLESYRNRRIVVLVERHAIPQSEVIASHLADCYVHIVLSPGRWKSSEMIKDSTREISLPKEWRLLIRNGDGFVRFCRDNWTPIFEYEGQTKPDSESSDQSVVS